ncbi:MAG TPA: TetR/AcrR family transcriptional regulator [Terriglobales bacterium]|nr:TetR/AcrR family transcriptional regulator [Terriglobales bacterium]
MTAPKESTRSSTEARIIEAAVQLFSRQGFTGSSTSEIAKLAGVSEVTVFRHFPRKKELFWAATESRLRRLRISKELKQRLELDENPRTALPGIISLLVETVRHQPETIRLLYISLFQVDQGAERVLRKHLATLFEPVQQYLSRCAAKGLIRDLEPGVAALGLAASVAAHENLKSILSQSETLCTSTDDAIAAYTDFWTKALVPDLNAPTVYAAESAAVMSFSTLHHPRTTE